MSRPKRFSSLVKQEAGALEESDVGAAAAKKSAPTLEDILEQRGMLATAIQPIEDSSNQLMQELGDVARCSRQLANTITDALRNAPVEVRAAIISLQEALVQRVDSCMDRARALVTMIGEKNANMELFVANAVLHVLQQGRDDTSPFLTTHGGASDDPGETLVVSVANPSALTDPRPPPPEAPDPAERDHFFRLQRSEEADRIVHARSIALI